MHHFYFAAELRDRRFARTTAARATNANDVGSGMDVTEEFDTDALVASALPPINRPKRSYVNDVSLGVMLFSV